MMSINNVVVFVDIDGPLNPFLSFTAADDESFVYCGGEWNKGLFNVVDHKQWLHNIIELGAQLVWVSNWGDETVVISELFELPILPWVEFKGSQVSNGSWKLPFVKEYIDAHFNNSSVIWLDDQLEEDAFMWADERGNTLLVKPDPAVGWTLEQYNSMITFIINS